MNIEMNLTPTQVKVLDHIVLNILHESIWDKKRQTYAIEMESCIIYLTRKERNSLLNLFQNKLQQAYEEVSG